MKYVAIIAVFLILVGGALLALRMINTHTRKKAEWKVLRDRTTLAEATIRQIDKELDVAKAAGMGVDSFILDNIISDYTSKRDNPNVKEIAS